MLIFRVNSWQELLIGLLVRIFIILCILPVHEYAHALAAYKLGDPTAKSMGRLTLNPVAHIDWIGAAAIILLGFGWAKPVPVNPFRFRDQSKRKSGMAITALAGPLSNIIVAIAGMILLRVIASIPAWSIDSFGAQQMITYGFYFLISINISLAVFNLIPIYPLDGSRILGRFLPDSVTDFFEKNGRIITIVFMVLIFSGKLDGILNFLVGGVQRGLFAAVNGLFDLVGLKARGLFEYTFYDYGLISF